MPRPTLADACPSGFLDPDDWCDELITMVADPSACNRDLLLATQTAARGLGAARRRAWMDNLMEFCLWETGRAPGRLALCDHLYRQGLAPISQPARWASYGGLLHVACEAASFEGIQWALDREPSAAVRVGSRHGLTAFHALCNREIEEGTLEAAALLASRGARADRATRDGRNPLFRCSQPELAQALMALGADPWSLDGEGFCAAGLWLEGGHGDCALAAFAAAPSKIDQPLPWGSLSSGRMGPARMDRPLFIVACAPMLAQRGEEREAMLRGLIEAGACPLSLDARGATLAERGNCSLTLSLWERASLAGARSREERAGASARL